MHNTAVVYALYRRYLFYPIKTMLFEWSRMPNEIGPAADRQRVESINIKIRRCQAALHATALTKIY